MTLRFNQPPPLPRLNPRRAIFVLSKIDEILVWEKRVEAHRDTKFVELGRYLCEVRAGQYWRVENLKSFDEFLERRFPESRRKAYYLMSIHEHLPPQARKELKQVGWAKAAELTKVARSDGKAFDCATWLHKAIDCATWLHKADKTFRSLLRQRCLVVLQDSVGQDWEPISTQCGS